MDVVSRADKKNRDEGSTNFFSTRRLSDASVLYPPPFSSLFSSLLSTSIRPTISMIRAYVSQMERAGSWRARTKAVYIYDL